MKLAWAYFAQDRLVQLPFEHYDYISSRATSVSEFLNRGGWMEFWTTSVFSAAVMLVILAGVAAAGEMAGRARRRVLRSAS